MTHYYRCKEGHVFKREPNRLGPGGRTKCGRCHAYVVAVPCPEAAPLPTAKRNPFAPSIARQRAAGARWQREKRAGRR